jgi:FKBP-type peptidyl-prolyl cis-trans isomerase FkpA
MLGSISCLKNDTEPNNFLSEEDQLALDISIIQEYLDAKGLKAESMESGLHFIIQEEGDSEFPDINSTVTVNYKGYFTDETIFDQSEDGMPLTFGLAQVIPGWQEGIPIFDRGGKGVLLLPSKLGYGRNPPFGFPINAVLIFDVELIDFE